MAIDRGRQIRGQLLEELYGRATAGRVAADLEALLDRHGRRPPSGRPAWDASDAWLITYADQFQAPGERPLQTLDRFIGTHLEPEINGVHVLPFYPWTSDDGFSVTDYLAVDPGLGTWEDIARLASARRLMVDAVVNHMSVSSSWFRGFLAGDPEFAGFFRTADPAADLSATTRPRTSPLLHPFEGTRGTRWVWTTFSADQVDLDYANPAVLLRVVDVLLTYASRGAGIIRLDAIAFLWKVEGTTSLHLPQTHTAVQLMRAALDACYPDVLLITETNVPHEENISYFGVGGAREAQAVYQFPLAPLTLHAILTGDASVLARWAAGLGAGRAGTTFFNFLASHDGVGVRPVEGLLAPAEIALLAERSVAAGGQVGLRALPDGSETPYELNSTWFDLVGAGHDEGDAIARHLATHAVMLALRGIPGLYVHSLFGTSNDQEGYAATGIKRRLNRRKFSAVDDLEARLADRTDRARRVWDGMRVMLAARRVHPAFDPESAQRVLDGPPGVLAIEREAGDGGRARVLVNLRGVPAAVGALAGPGWRPLTRDRGLPDVLGPWQHSWLSDSW